MKKIVLNLTVVFFYFLSVGEAFAEETLPDGYPPSPYGGTDDDPPGSIDNAIIWAMMAAIIVACYFIQKQKTFIKSR